MWQSGFSPRPSGATVCTHLWHDFCNISDDEISKDFAMPEMQQEIDGRRFFAGNFGDARLKKLERCYTNKW
jgi:hypothetical protein